MPQVSREIVVLSAAFSTVDPGNIFETLDALKVGIR